MGNTVYMTAQEREDIKAILSCVDKFTPDEKKITLGITIGMRVAGVINGTEPKEA